MKLFYYKSDFGNFGDDLNPWLWPQILGELDAFCSADWLVGIGTILDRRLDDLPGTKLVMGSGFNPALPTSDRKKEIQIAFVRGPLSAKALGLEESKSVTDGAILVSRLFDPSKLHKRGRPLFIPHFHTAINFDCARAAEMADVDYLDPRSSVSHSLHAIGQASIVIAEAMHGAIVADALRIPWLRIRAHNYIRQPRMAEFKWQDWGMSMSVMTNSVADARIPRYTGRGSSLLRRLLCSHSCSVIARTIIAGLRSSKGTLSSDQNHGRALERVVACCEDIVQGRW